MIETPTRISRFEPEVVCENVTLELVVVAVEVASIEGEPPGVLVGAGVLVGVFVGGTGVLVGVLVGGTGVLVGVLVGGTGVLVGVFVGGTGVTVASKRPPPPGQEMERARDRTSNPLLT